MDFIIPSTTQMIRGIPIGRLEALERKVASLSAGSFSGLQELSTTTPNGIVQTFSFGHTPTLVFWNGALQRLTADYTVSSNNITFTGDKIPLTDDLVVNTY